MIRPTTGLRLTKHILMPRQRQRSASSASAVNAQQPMKSRPLVSITRGPGGVVANLIRNYWPYIVIFCGHFPDGAEKFTREEYEAETHPEWYLRQMLGSANFNAGRLMAFMSGNLCYQIEHHLFPDLPSNRYAEISERITALCDKYDLPYTTGSLGRQYMQTFWTILKLSLPNKLLEANEDDAPETHSELKFRIRAGVRDSFGVDPDTGRRRGLRTAVRELRNGDVATA
jgi:fatty acid desaturase